MSAAIQPTLRSDEKKEYLIQTLQNPVKARLGAERFDTFTSLVLPKSFSKPPSEFHDKLVSVIAQNQMTAKREAVVGPRGWGKSTTITEAGPLWIICRNKYMEEMRRYKYIVIISETEDQAKARLDTIKTELANNEVLASLYPDAAGVGSVWKTDRIITKNGVCVQVSGMNSAIRGLKYQDRRPDLMIIDDPDSLESAMSKAKSDQYELKFSKDISECGHDRTDILVVGTIITEMCLLYKIGHSDLFADYNYTLFPAIKEFPSAKEMKYWDMYGYILKNRLLGNRELRRAAADEFYKLNIDKMSGGVSSWPKVHSMKSLMTNYYAIGRKAFMTEKQNSLLSNETRYFNIARYTYISDTDYGRMIEQAPPLLFAYVDPTGGQSQKRGKRNGDKFCITVVAKFSRYYVLAESISKECTQSEQFDIIYDVLKKYKIFKLSVEGNGGQQLYVSILKQKIAEKMRDTEWVASAKTKNTLVPRQIMNCVSKEHRIRALEPFLDTGTLLLRENMAQRYPDLFAEFEAWPHAAYDDSLDSLSGSFFSSYKTYKLITGA